MPDQLIYSDSNDRLIAYPLPAEGAIIGRASGCAIRSLHFLVSRQHCRVFSQGGRWYVEDMASRNGTFVNLKRVGIEELRHGAIIHCGNLELRFVTGEEHGTESGRYLRASASLCQGRSPGE